MRLHPLLVRLVFVKDSRLTNIRSEPDPVIMMTMMNSAPETLEMSEDCGKTTKTGSQRNRASLNRWIAYVLDPMISQMVNGI